MFYVSDGLFVALYKLLYSNCTKASITDNSIFSKLYPYSAAITKASVLTIKPELYSSTKTSGTIVCDRFDIRITSVGNKSCETESILSNNSTGRDFVRLVDRIMFIDLNRNKFIQLEKLKNELMLRGIHLTSSAITIQTTPPIVPVFTATRVVGAHQVDHHRHLSVPWYAIMTVDVIDKANSENFFKQPSYDFTSTGMKVVHMELVHQGEALLGDTLVFTIWWEVDVIKIQVTKNTTTNIAFLVIGLDKNNTKACL